MKAGKNWKEALVGKYLHGLEQALGRNPRAELDRARASLEKEPEAYLDQAHADASIAWQEGPVRAFEVARKHRRQDR
jgi:hypothetical protein